MIYSSLGGMSNMNRVNSFGVMVLLSYIIIVAIFSVSIFLQGFIVDKMIYIIGFILINIWYCVVGIGLSLCEILDNTKPIYKIRRKRQ